MNLKQFTHRFKNGTIVTLSYDLDLHQPGQMAHAKIEWSARPNRRMMREYMRWKHSVCDKLASLVNGRLMDVIQTKRDLCEVWVHEPGRAGVKVGETGWPPYNL